MTFASNVAPPKIPLRPKPQPWRCHCLEPFVPFNDRLPDFQQRPGYLVRCPVCKTPRPD